MMMNKLFMQPVINENVIWQENDGGVILFIENDGFFNRVFQAIMHKPKISYIHLDEIGSYVWKMLDGNNSIYEIGAALEKEFDNSAFPLYERLTKFLGMLKENEFITFILK